MIKLTQIDSIVICGWKFYVVDVNGNKWLDANATDRLYCLHV
jgi:hypothetical protein